MPNTDAERLVELEEWRDNLIAALKAPETHSAFGGMPDANGPGQVSRMAGRAQLRSELAEVRAEIEEIKERTPYTRVSRAVT